MRFTSFSSDVFTIQYKNVVESQSIKLIQRVSTFMNIDGKTLFLSKRGPQKPPKLTDSRIDYEK